MSEESKILIWLLVIMFIGLPLVLTLNDYLNGG